MPEGGDQGKLPKLPERCFASSACVTYVIAAAAYTVAVGKGTPMKIKYSKNRWIFLILVILVAALGYCIGSVTYRYQVVVNGILGIATFLLLTLVIFPLKNFQFRPTDSIRVEFPRDIKYIVVGVFLATVIYWSGRHLGDTISYCINIIKSGF